MSVVVIAALIVVVAVLAVVAFIFYAAWRLSLRSGALLAQRLDTEAQMEAATLQTMSAMREAARAYSRQQV